MLGQRRLVSILVASAALLLVALVAVPWARVLLEPSGPSRSIGRPGSGSLEGGRPIRPWGDGFVTYSLLGSALGRQYVHAAVRDTLVDAFATRARQEPGRTFVVGETGWPTGGSFRPHRTHQSGTSVDLFVPLHRTGEPVSIPTWPWLGFGYAVELDAQGNLGDSQIDFASLAALLGSLEAAGAGRGVRVRKVIIAPELVPFLEPHLTASLRRVLVRTPVWVRHDDHVHVDFEVAGVGRTAWPQQLDGGLARAEKQRIVRPLAKSSDR